MIGWTLLACATPKCGVEAGPSCGATFPTDGSEPTDTAVELGDITVLAKIEECTGPEWWYAYDLSDRPVDAELTILGTLADGTRAEERHTLALESASHWQASVTLVVVDDPASQLSGVSTRFGCERSPTMTWRLFDWDALDCRSCLVWGAEPAMLEAEGCLRW